MASILEVSPQEWERIEKSIGSTVYDHERKEFINSNLEPTGMPIGDWRDFIPDYVRNQWHELDTRARLCVFAMAKEAAERHAADPRWDE